MSKRILFEQDKLNVFDYRCSMGPDDKPFVEQHCRHSLSYVRKGSFGYSTRGQFHELVAGAVMIGHAGDDYICSHPHHICGDECLSFQLSPEMADDMNIGKGTLQLGYVRPLPELMVYGELADAACRGYNDFGVDEAAVIFVSRFIAAVSGKLSQPINCSARDRRRAVEAALWIDAHSTEDASLESAAKRAGVSAFHFLRMFSNVLGVTPHQYLIRSRLRHAAQLLADRERSITSIAFDVGFGDLSNFVRTFHRAAGISPKRFRAIAQGDRNILQERLSASALG